MEITKEKIEDKIKDALYAQVGLAATVNDKLKDKVDEYIERGKIVNEKGKDIKDDIKRVFDKDEPKNVDDIIASLSEEQLEELKAKLK